METIKTISMAVFCFIPMIIVGTYLGWKLFLVTLDIGRMPVEGYLHLKDLINGKKHD